MELKTSSKHWYVAYTFPNAEKSIQRNLVKMQITSFLPLRETVREWKDRRKKVSTPLFPNYIFIYSSHNERYEALCIKGIVKYVSFEGKPAIIRNEQIESLKRLVHGDIEVHQRSVLKPRNNYRGAILRCGRYAGTDQRQYTIGCGNRLSGQGSIRQHFQHNGNSHF